VRVYGPAFLHLYGVDEDVVLTTWTVDKFERYRLAADDLLQRGR
jgi:hypothetical protein